MITEEERQSIISEAVEKVLLMIPDTMGNLMTNHMALLEMNKKFYLKYPELRDKKDIVTSVVEMIEGRDPTVDYNEILCQAVPEIKKRIAQVSNLNCNIPPKPSRHIKDVVFDPNGEI